MNQRIKQLSSSLFSALFTLLLCMVVPFAQASDIEVYTEAEDGNITVMLQLDQSLSMALPTWGIAACDLPDGFGLDLTTGNEDFVNKYTDPDTNALTAFSYKRHFCKVKKPKVVFRQYYNLNGQLTYNKCTIEASTYKECEGKWGPDLTYAQRIADTTPAPYVYRIPGSVNDYVWYNKTNTEVKVYDRLTKVKDGLYEALYGPNKIGDNKFIGLSVFPYSPSYYSGAITVPARRLSASVGSIKQRQVLMTAIAAMKEQGVTPTANAYADVAAYLMGTNTLRRPLQKIVAAEKIDWQRCYEFGAEPQRSIDGTCLSWWKGGVWWNFNDPFFANENAEQEIPIEKCNIPTGQPGAPGVPGNDINQSNPLRPATNCYGKDMIMPRYALKQAQNIDLEDASEATLEANRDWLTCTSWYRDGKCIYWHKTATVRAADLGVWNPDKPTDARLFVDPSSSSLTAAQKATAYPIISAEDYCTGYAAAATRCFGQIIPEAAFYAIRKYYKWKTCTLNSAEGACLAWLPLGTANETWSDVKPTIVTDNLEKDFCTFAGYASICYFEPVTNATKTAYYLYSGFEFNVGAEQANIKVNKNGDADFIDVQDTYKMPDSVKAQVDDTSGKTCGAQGIYILTDGEANGSDGVISRELYKAALSSDSNLASAANFNCSVPEFGGAGSMWGCMANFSKSLLNPNENPAEIKIQTATVGFGAEYIDLPAYDNGKSESENMAAIRDFYAVSEGKKNLAYLGITGQGGWYRGTDAETVTQSLNDFISKSAGSINPLTMGTVNIPQDALNPSKLQPFAYYPEFQPTPDKKAQLWFGNVRKYQVLDGLIKDKDGITITNSVGKLKDGLKDYWDAVGALGNVPLRKRTDDTALGKIGTRNVISNRVLKTDGTYGDSSTALTKITTEYLKTTDSARAYLMGLLGFNISLQEAESPASLNLEIIEKKSELRQMGGAYHSTPILLTQSGKVVFNSDGTIDTQNRDEYILFGTSQGLLQVVDADNGEEKFAFVPNEMIEKQKKSFVDPKAAGEGLTNLYYGVDAPWTSYTEYVPKGNDGLLTVGTGLGGQAGKQWVYGGLRMGGRSYYALDLTNIDNPKLKFQINPDANTSGPLSFMGESWSKPTLAYVRWKGTRKLVMFVGGGYDRGYEVDNYDQTNGRGAGVYMFDADNGDLLWWSSANATNNNTGLVNNALANNDMKYSVVSRINTIDRNNDGYVDHLYFGDLGGQAWRIDLNNYVTTTNGQFAIRAQRLLNVNISGGKSPRFYEAPNVSVYEEPSVGRFAVVALASGNRSAPLKEYRTSALADGRVNDAVYAVFDKDVGTKTVMNTSHTIVTQNLTRSNLILNDLATTISYANNGWYFPLVSEYIQSAKSLGESVSINKNLYVPVYDASKQGIVGSCSTGAKGITNIKRFCLPYGVCAGVTNQLTNELFVGAGILGVNIGGGDNGFKRQVVGGSCTTDNKCTTYAGGDPLKNNVKTPNDPIFKLAPTRWMEKFAKSETSGMPKTTTSQGGAQ